MTVTFQPEGEPTPISLFPVNKYKPTLKDKYQFAGRLNGNPLFYIQPTNEKIEIVSTWNKDNKVGTAYIWDYLMNANHYGILVCDGTTYNQVVVTYEPDFAVATTGRVCIMTMVFEVVSSV